MHSAGAAPREIGIVVYPGAQPAAVLGLTDLFGIAARLAADSRPGAVSPLRVSHWAPDRDGAIRCCHCSEPGAAPRPGILILPPTLSRLPDPGTCARIARWLRDHHARGVRLATVCSGAFLVAGTGLLDGRTVSTHRSCAAALIEAYPAVGIDTEARMIDLGDVLTAGGFMAWVDVGLLLIERLLGEAVRRDTARFVRHDPSAGPGQAFSGLPGRQGHGDGAVQRAQEFVHVRDGRDVSLASVAAAAGLERRTLLRRFTAATGLTPMDYARAVRLARGRELLAGGTMPLQRVAASLGYADLSSFSRAFRRAYGVSPGAVRAQAGSAGGEAGSSGGRRAGPS